MKFAFMLVVLLLAFPARAQTDFKCVNDCTANGYMYNLCMQRCTVQAQPAQQYRQLQSPPPVQPQQFQPAKRVDYQCMNNCSQAGYQYGFCKDKCSY